MHMDRKLQLIAHLYDEDLDGLEPLGSLLEDPDLRAEYEAMGETRFGLEHRERVRPDPRLVDAVVAAALARESVARDRSPMRLVRSQRFWVSATSVAASILLLVLFRPWQSGSLLPVTDELVADSQSFPPAETLLKSLPPAPPAIATASEEPAQAARLDWDTGGDVRHLSRRIERLKAAGIDGWDNPAVPLEAPPTGSGTNGLFQTGTRRPNQ